MNYKNLLIQNVDDTVSSKCLECQNLRSKQQVKTTKHDH